MRSTIDNGSRATLAAFAAALVTLALFLLVGSPRGADAGARACANADATLAEAGVRKMRRAVGCLINSERTDRGRKALRVNPALDGVARRHTRVMLKRNCFRHQCPGERDLRTRIEKSGYVKSGRYGYGEVLGCSTTPAGMVATWMGKRFHRKNILDRKFRHFGIGAKRGAPKRVGGCTPRRRHVTYTVVFGWRQR